MGQHRAFAFGGPYLWNYPPSVIRSKILLGVTLSSLNFLKIFVFPRDCHADPTRRANISEASRLSIDSTHAGDNQKALGGRVDSRGTRDPNEETEVLKVSRYEGDTVT